MNIFFNKMLDMIKKLHITRISFTDGSYIEHFNREAILYAEENGQKMEIVWYFQPRSIKGRILYKSDINYWDSPYENESISLRKREDILDKIVEYCNKKRIPLSIREKQE
jgi:hypothetical protein